ncbi:unnamed protein product [Sphagnum balticum]
MMIVDVVKKDIKAALTTHHYGDDVTGAVLMRQPNSLVIGWRDGRDARNVASPHRSHAVRSVVACDRIVCTRAAGCVAVWTVAAANTSTDGEDESIV